MLWIDVLNRTAAAKTEIPQFGLQPCVGKLSPYGWISVEFPQLVIDPVKPVVAYGVVRHVLRQF